MTSFNIIRTWSSSSPEYWSAFTRVLKTWVALCTNRPCRIVFLADTEIVWIKRALLICFLPDSKVVTFRYSGNQWWRRHNCMATPPPHTYTHTNTRKSSAKENKCVKRKQKRNEKNKVTQIIFSDKQEFLSLPLPAHFSSQDSFWFGSLRCNEW